MAVVHFSVLSQPPPAGTVRCHARALSVLVHALRGALISMGVVKGGA
jgi:hypothetical protein